MRDRQLLQRLQCQSLQYFLDNQTPAGLILDRQRNHGALRSGGLCSLAATGMGWIALALASGEPYRLLTPREAVLRIRTGLETALHTLPHDGGIMPHFVDSCTGRVQGIDYLSTVESAWMAAGALWAAAFLREDGLEQLASALAERIDWYYWTAPNESKAPLLRHGQTRDGRFLSCSWDRLNGETVFMYVLAAGADKAHALPVTAWSHLRSFHGTAAELHFNNSDLGLFVFQYGLDLLDLSEWLPPGGVDLAAEAAVAAEANYRVSRNLADTYTTYREYWGLSAGDGPAAPPTELAYRCYAPGGPIDGTAHLTATLASIAQRPDLVWENIDRASHRRHGTLVGRYGFSNVNVDQHWIGPDMVGIDAGAAVLALDNYLNDNRVRSVFHSILCVQRGLERSGFCSRLAQTLHAA
ncbi:MAG TPA: glucoamylase family protein [Gemmataceae bacterium]|nr:glucoamylase family protein [Gemmataceae bacterium]